MFKLCLKQCYLIVWNVQKTSKKNPKVVKTKNGRIMLWSKCSVRNQNFLKKNKLEIG